MKIQTSLTNIKSIIEDLSEFTDTPGHGVTRFSYGEQDKKARKYIIGLCEDLGLSVRTDAVGNIFARLEGKDPMLSPIITGSHIDSVKQGGKFDGIVGCVCGLEAVRVLVENNYCSLRPIELATARQTHEKIPKP